MSHPQSTRRDFLTTVVAAGSTIVAAPIFVPSSASGGADTGAWALRQALIDHNDLTTVLEYQKQRFLYPEHDWEKKGFTGRTTVCNGLIHFKGRWLLYYGAADRVIGLAACRRTK